MDKDDIAAVFDHAGAMAKEGESLQSISRELLPSITTQYTVSGMEHIPAFDPFIAVANHPSHMDYFFAKSVLEKRPDLRIVARVPPQSKESFPSRTSFLQQSRLVIPLQSEENGTYVREGLEQLIETVRSGVSIVIVPWGCMDHQALKEAGIDESIRHVLHLARAGSMHVLMATTSIESSGETVPGPLPFKRVRVQISRPIPPTDQHRIASEVSSLYVGCVLSS